MIKFKIKTWCCDNSNCRYKQDFEPNKDKFNELFLRDKKIASRVKTRDYKKCPSCGVGNMVKETDHNKKIDMILLDEDITKPRAVWERIDGKNRRKLDQYGNPVFEIKKVKAMTPEEIQSKRDKYEDK